VSELDELVQHVSAESEVEWLDGQLVSSDDKHSARLEELRKLLAFDSFVAVPLTVGRGKPLFPFKWVDKMKDGAIKSRITVADLKSKDPNKELSEVFAPTPSKLAETIFEAVALRENLLTTSADVVSAFPHAKETEEVYMRVPKEFAEAVGMEFTYASGGLDLQNMDPSEYKIRLLANVFGRRTAP